MLVHLVHLAGSCGSPAGSLGSRGLPARLLGSSAGSVGLAASLLISPADFYKINLLFDVFYLLIYLAHLVLPGCSPAYSFGFPDVSLGLSAGLLGSPAGSLGIPGLPASSLG